MSMDETVVLILQAADLSELAGTTFDRTIACRITPGPDQPKDDAMRKSIGYSGRRFAGSGPDHWTVLAAALRAQVKFHDPGHGHCSICGRFRTACSGLQSLRPLAEQIIQGLLTPPISPAPAATPPVPQAVAGTVEPTAAPATRTDNGGPA